ncbi:MAG TPA: hypothetical protein P5200_09470 [Tenuifilaceae bacterium]|nr:hypothetical protein [Tenuifilaceae bacterium]
MPARPALLVPKGLYDFDPRPLKGSSWCGGSPFRVWGSGGKSHAHPLSLKGGLPVIVYWVSPQGVGGSGGKNASPHPFVLCLRQVNQKGGWRTIVYSNVFICTEGLPFRGRGQRREMPAHTLGSLKRCAEFIEVGAGTHCNNFL